MTIEASISTQSAKWNPCRVITVNAKIDAIEKLSCVNLYVSATKKPHLS